MILTQPRGKQFTSDKNEKKNIESHQIVRHARTGGARIQARTLPPAPAQRLEAGAGRHQSLAAAGDLDLEVPPGSLLMVTGKTGSRPFTDTRDVCLHVTTPDVFVQKYYYPGPLTLWSSRQ